MSRIPKFRGKRRYFRNLYKRVSTYKVPSSSWFNLWHYHVDWYGRSVISGRSKRQHEEALRILLSNIERQMKERDISSQVWMHIDPVDSTNNAVFIHTPNPHTSFPITY